MAELTEEQKLLIEESIKAAQAGLKHDGVTHVVYSGIGKFTCDNPHFEIEQRKGD